MAAAAAWRPPGRRDHDERLVLGRFALGIGRRRHDRHDHLFGRHRRAPLDMLDDTQLVLAGAERRILGEQHPFTAGVGHAAGDFLAAVEQHDLGARRGTAGDHRTALRPDACDIETWRHDRRGRGAACSRSGLARHNRRRAGRCQRGRLGSLVDDRPIAYLPQPGDCQRNGDDRRANRHQPENRACQPAPNGATTDRYWRRTFPRRNDTVPTRSVKTSDLL